jgi:PAS domain-containing protein
MGDPRPVVAYGLAFASSAVALGLTRLEPTLTVGAPFLLSFAAVMITSWYGGLGPGLVTVMTCATGSTLFLLGGMASLAVPSKAMLLSGFVLVATLIAALNSARQRVQRARLAEHRSRVASERVATERTVQYAAERAERERAERAEADLRAILDGAPDAMLIADAAGAIVLANSQVERVFGYAPAELLGQPVELLVPDRLRAGIPHAARPTSMSRASGRWEPISTSPPAERTEARSPSRSV